MSLYSRPPCFNDRTIPSTTNIYIKEWMHKQLKVIFFWMNERCNSSKTCRIISQTFITCNEYKKVFSKNKKISTIFWYTYKHQTFILNFLPWLTIWTKFSLFSRFSFKYLSGFFFKCSSICISIFVPALTNASDLVKSKNKKIKNFLTPHAKFLRLLKGSRTAVYRIILKLCSTEK